MKSNLSNTIISPQRYLGISSQEYLKVEGRNAPSQLKHQGNERFFKVNCHGEDTKITPEQSVAAFFTHVQKTVELNHINNKFLTVAIPNYFTHQEKQALIDSLEISKRSCKHQFGIQLVNESTAVGLDYGFYKKTEFPEKEEEAKNIMFIDLGHSKLSLYVIKFTKNYQKVVYQNHLRQLGCKNFDELMLNFYSELFERSNPNLELSVS
jgi:heat shock protein 4